MEAKNWSNPSLSVPLERALDWILQLDPTYRPKGRRSSNSGKEMTALEKEVNAPLLALAQIATSDDEVFSDSLEAEDIRATLGGDSDAYGRIVGRYQSEISRQMWRFTRDRSVLADLTHDVFIEAYLCLGRFRGEAPLLHWLRKIAVRVGYRYWKNQAKERSRRPEQDTHDVGGNAPSASDALESQEAAEILHQKLNLLAPRDRLVLTLMYFDGRSVAQIADLLGWSQTMVKVQAFRARGKLKKLMGDFLA